MAAIDINTISWGKLEACKQAMASLAGKDLMNAAPAVVKELYGIDIMDKPVPEVFGVAAFFDRIAGFLNRFASLSDYENEPEEIEAGVDELQKFGVFSTIDTLSSGNPMKYNAILEVPAISIYNKLFLDMERNAYQKRLRKVFDSKRPK